MFSHQTTVCKCSDKCSSMEYCCFSNNVGGSHLLFSVLYPSPSVVQCCAQDPTLSIPVLKLTIPTVIPQVSIQRPKGNNINRIANEKSTSVSPSAIAQFNLHPKPTSSSQDSPTSTPRSTDFPIQVLRSHHYHYFAA
jgi:hypothetical protein